MRITLDTTPLLGRATGVGRYVDRLLRALAALDADGGAERLDLRATTWTWRGGRLTDLPPGVRQVGPRVPARLVREAWARTDHPRIETLVGATDVVHGTNFVSPPARRAREVVTVHDLTYLDHRDTVAAASLRYDVLVGRALRRGAHVVTPSRTVADAVRERYGLGADRVTATPLGVDDAWYDAAPPDAAWLARRGLPADYLLFVGSLDPRKNLPALLRAHGAARGTAGDVPDLVLAGPAGREDAVAPGAGVHLTGWLEDADLQRLVAGARAVVLPSLEEGFGLPALEASAAGRPVLAADIPALREVVGPLAAFADPRDDDALRAGLVAVVAGDDSPAERERRRAHARTYTWDACARRTLAAYRGEEAA